jgi:hypothetical protein
MDKDALLKALFKDLLIVNVEIHPDVRQAEARWASELGLVRPNYNVVSARPGQDLSGFGAVWTQSEEDMFRTRGVVVLKPQVQGHA